MKFIEVEQGSKEWLELRRTKIGASDCGAIMGVDPHCTASQLWNEKMTGEKRFVSNAMRRGADLEKVARDMYNARTGLNFQPCVALHDTHDWMMASLDGYDAGRLLEIKCPGEDTLKEFRKGNIPTHWVYQCQHQMEVFGARTVMLIVFDGKDLITNVVSRNDNLIKEILEKEEAFFHSMQVWEPPKPSLPERIDEPMIEIIKSLKETRARIKDLEELEKIQIESALYLSENKEFTCQGMSARQIVKKGNVDYAKIPELKDVDLEKHRKAPSTYWKLA